MWGRGPARRKNNIKKKQFLRHKTRLGFLHLLPYLVFYDSFNNSMCVALRYRTVLCAIVHTVRHM